MGTLRIRTQGSFHTINEAFTAQSSGHAVAVDNAIRFLQEFKEEAKIQDLELRQDGCAPDDGFAEADKRGLLGDEEYKP